MEKYEKHSEEIDTNMVNEPAIRYNTSSKNEFKPRIVSTDEIMSRSVTLEELDRHLTGLIHNHYHPEV